MEHSQALQGMARGLTEPVGQTTLSFTGTGSRTDYCANPILVPNSPLSEDNAGKF